MPSPSSSRSPSRSLSISASQTIRPCPTCSSVTPTVCAPSCPLALLDEYSSSTESLPRLIPDFCSDFDEDPESGLDDDDDREQHLEERARGRKQQRKMYTQEQTQVQADGGESGGGGEKPKPTSQPGDRHRHRHDHGDIVMGAAGAGEADKTAPLTAAADDIGNAKKSTAQRVRRLLMGRA